MIRGGGSGGGGGVVQKQRLTSNLERKKGKTARGLRLERWEGIGKLLKKQEVI